jgi:pimeloyl-ACP methyl ester carboxylesterase
MSADDDEHGYWLSLLGELGSNQERRNETSENDSDGVDNYGGDSAYLYVDVQGDSTTSGNHVDPNVTDTHSYPQEENETQGEIRNIVLNMYSGSAISEPPYSSIPNRETAANKSITEDSSETSTAEDDLLNLYAKNINPDILAQAEAKNINPDILAQAEAVPPPVTEQIQREKQIEETAKSFPKPSQPYRRRQNMWLSDEAQDDDLGDAQLTDEYKALQRLDRHRYSNKVTQPGATVTATEGIEHRPIISLPGPFREDIPSPVITKKNADKKTDVSAETDQIIANANINKSQADYKEKPEELQVIDYKVKVLAKSSGRGRHRSRRNQVVSNSMWNVGAATTVLNTVQSVATATWTNWERQIMENRYVREALGVAAQSLQVALDRGHSLAVQYFSSMISDDPEQQHLQRIRQGHVWEHVALRCSLASLSFRQRQLMQETRAESLPDADKLASMTPAQLREYEKQQLLLSMQQICELKGLVGKASNSLVVGSTNAGGTANSEDEFTSHALSLYLPTTRKTNDGSDAEEEVDDDDFQFAMARFLTPPAFVEASQCHVCSQKFGITLFRHHCRHCGKSCCDDHSRSRRRILRFGLVSPVRVCDRCAICLDELRRVDQLVWRDGRVKAWLAGRLLPVTYATIYGDRDIDRSVDKALRVADYSLTVARNALILNFPTKVALETIEVLKRYGLTGFAGLLLTGEFMEAIETLKQLVRVDDMFPSLHELTACVYYKLAIDRGLRGCQPDLPLETHRDTDMQRRMWQQYSLLEDDDEDGDQSSSNALPSHDCRHATERDVSLAIQYAPLALDIVYENNELDMRRLGKYHGLELLCSNVSAEDNEELRRRPEQPVYALFVPQAPPNPSTSTASHKSEAIVAIRGTQSVQDVVTDVRARPIRFPPPDHTILDLLHGRAVHPSLFEHNAQTSSQRQSHAQYDVSVSTVDAVVRESRAIEEHELQMYQQQHPTSTAQSTTRSQHQPQNQHLSASSADTESRGDQTNEDKHGLGKEYVCEGMARSALYVLAELGPALLRLLDSGCDLRIVGHSLGGAVAALLTLLLRRGFVALHDQHEGRHSLYQHHRLRIRGLAYGPPSCLSAALSDELLDPDLPHQRLSAQSSSRQLFFGSDKQNVPSSNGNAFNPKGFLTVILRDDVISRVTPQSARQLLREILLFRDGVFRHLQQDWSDVIQRAKSLWAPRMPRSYHQHPHSKKPQSDSNSGFMDGLQAVLAESQQLRHSSSQPHQRTASTTTQRTDNIAEAEGSRDEEGSDGEEEEEEEEDMWNEVDLWLPGEVLHVYPWRGQWLGAVVSRNFPPLRHIEVQGHIFEDHRSHNIFNALLETLHVQRLRAGTVGGQQPTTNSSNQAHVPFSTTSNNTTSNTNTRAVPPSWMPFDCADKCTCCMLPFTWHSTFRGAAQEFRERYNCRNCGSLVCGPCSKQRKSIPRLGMLAPRRVCDRCFLRGDFSS